MDSTPEALFPSSEVKLDPFFSCSIAKYSKAIGGLLVQNIKSNIHFLHRELTFILTILIKKLNIFESKEN